MSQVSPPRPDLSRAWFLGGFERKYIDLFLISFLGLFLELACIRWFGSTVVYLTFFTNFVLMACFLGLSVGCLTVDSRRDYIGAVLPVLFATAILAFVLLWGYYQGAELNILVGRQNSPEQIYFGTETRPRDISMILIPVEVIAAGFFTLISLSFIGVGQVTGRAFNAVGSPVVAYAVNLSGSLAGIVAFGVLSLFRTPPAVWFGLCAVVVLYFVRKPLLWVVSAATGGLLVLGLLLTADLPQITRGDDGYTIWSPYYKVRFEEKNHRLYVNNIRHQAMDDMTRGGSFYHLPYLMIRQAKGPPTEDVLIIGAGSGNDVAAALAEGAKHVDAVEIDPVLYETGRKYHPNRPAEDPRVTYHIDDGRSFVRRTQKKYDLIVYALVDSLVLHSGYSSIRLESFLFTEQAFRDIKEKLRPDGAFVMYNYYRQGWVVGRLAKLAERVFGSKPIVLSVPYLPVITPQDEQGFRFDFVIAGTTQSRTLKALWSRLEKDKFFWLSPDTTENGVYDAYGSAPPYKGSGTAPQDWFKLGPSLVETEGVGRLPADDYPFLYLRNAMIPGLNLRGMLLVAVISLAILFLFAPVRTARPNLQMFFLGAGFMLLETKGVVHMALLFGSTWIVNSIVFGAILVMALLSNLYVIKRKPESLWPYYALLVASLGLNLAVPMTSYLALPGAWRVVVSCVVVFLPVFFAGVVFATSFRASKHPNVDFGSNVGGVILGGLSENFSLVVGFGNLLVIAIFYYTLSALVARRTAN